MRCVNLQGTSVTYLLKNKTLFQKNSLKIQEIKRKSVTLYVII